VKRLTFFFSALAFVFLFSGCGQSGPLYLPGDPSTMVVPPDAADQSESETAEDSSESSEANE
jgi:predicted small lipoprotein YifL